MYNNTHNIILNADSYKASHFLQYPQGTTQVSSYIESRGGQFQQLVFFGLQMFLKEYLAKPVTHAMVDDAREFFVAHGVPFHEAGWRYIVDRHDGKLPIKVEAVPEGSVIPTKQVLVQVTNTDPECAWLTSYVETALLRAVWYPTTVATVSWHCRQVIEEYLAKTADNTESLPFKLHDFGARGATSQEAAALGGVAHLVNFSGSDTISGVLAAKRFYGAEMAGFSIPAAEHSTITSWGKDNELAAYKNMLAQFSGPGKLVAVVSDSYDLWHAIDNLWGDELRAQVENSGSTLVVRPDSGDPVSVVTETIERLMRKFGSRVNSKGYRVLPDCVRVIQGDGVSLQTIEAILAAMEQRKQSADNVAFGMGAELLQKVNRDTLKFAMKASAVKIEGLWRDVFKDPITDKGKRSKKGRLALVKTNQMGVNHYKTVALPELAQRENQLQTVFLNGDLLVDQSFEEIRSRAQTSQAPEEHEFLATIAQG